MHIPVKQKHLSFHLYILHLHPLQSMLIILITPCGHHIKSAKFSPEQKKYHTLSKYKVIALLRFQYLIFYCAM